MIPLVNGRISPGFIPPPQDGLNVFLTGAITGDLVPRHPNFRVQGHIGCYVLMEC